MCSLFNLFFFLTDLYYNAHTLVINVISQINKIWKRRTSSFRSKKKITLISLIDTVQLAFFFFFEETITLYHIASFLLNFQEVCTWEWKASSMGNREKKSEL
jgi:hypothetical protein